jgi:hypothetical protein
MSLPAPSKMVIVAYEKSDFTGKVGQYSAQVNPEKYSQSFSISYDKQGAPGSMNTALKFSRMPPAELKFELLFDATGVLDGSPKELTAAIADFQKIVYSYDGSIHEPRYLQITWGTLSFGARLTALSLSYTLFSPEGKPLRARADVTFANYESTAAIKKKEDRQSPDITHLVTVGADDRLPLLSDSVYRDTSWYFDLARHNNLVGFRRLQPGRVLRFPRLQ